MTDHHGNHHHHNEAHATATATAATSKTVENLMKVFNIFDGPVTFFRENIVQKLQKSYPYYHRNYNRVPTIDQCAYGDHVCIFEANEQFLRDRKVDKFITQILNNRARECYQREGPYDGFEKCRKLDEEYELALTNYYIKYGDLIANSNAIDAYMKQKHRLIWQRRNPDKDIVGFSKRKEIEKEIADYQKRAKNDPNLG